MQMFRLLTLVALIMGVAACASTPGSNVAATNEQLLTPEGTGPFPVVIILHTTRGLTEDERIWARRLVNAGYAALIIDSGSLTGSTSDAAYSWRLREVTKAMVRLQSLPTIHGDRIAILGRSHGAGVALLTLEKKVEPAPRAVVSIFPRCNRVPSWKVNVPVLYLLGDDDRLTPPGVCKEVANRLARKGRPVRYIAYPDVGHFFDTAGDQASRHAEQEVLLFLNTHLRTQ